MNTQMKFILVILTLAVLGNSYRLNREKEELSKPESRIKTATKYKSTTNTSTSTVSNSSNKEIPAAKEDSKLEVKQAVQAKEAKAESKMVEPEIKKAEVFTQEPCYYSPPPNFNDKYLGHTHADAFNPSNHPSMLTQYPENDVLPDSNAFWESFTPIVPKRKVANVKEEKTTPKRTEAEKAELYKEELKALKKEIFQDSNYSISNLRKEGKIYDTKWLAHQIKVTAVLRLEDSVRNYREIEKECESNKDKKSCIQDKLELEEKCSAGDKCIKEKECENVSSCKALRKRVEEKCNGREKCISDKECEHATSCKSFRKALEDKCNGREKCLSDKECENTAVCRNRSEELEEKCKTRCSDKDCFETSYCKSI